MNNRHLFSLILALLFSTFGVGLAIAQAQDPAAGPDINGPVDIQASEQEFVGDQIIAKGNVHVKYKDSLIIGPEATLNRGPNGSPQTAVFTGNAHLIQGENLINGEKLFFDIANHKILTEGKAHSEVGSADSKSGPSSSTSSDKIITDSDRQEYDQETERFDAFGHVHVITQDIKVTADKLKLVYGEDKKPETAIFHGNVFAIQGKNETHSDNMTYSLSTRRLQATGHVRSKVIQDEKTEEPTKPVQPVAIEHGPDAAMAANTPKTQDAKNEDVIITSDSQDYSKQTGRMSANGNVKVYYDDITGSGPQAILVRNDLGKPERVIFTNRSQVMQPGKRWVADHITLVLAHKMVMAQGNSKCYVLQPGAGNQQQAAPPPPPVDNSKLAGRPSSNETTSISASKIEAVR